MSEHTHVTTVFQTVTPEEFPWFFRLFTCATTEEKVRIIHIVVERTMCWSECHTDVLAMAARVALPEAEAALLAGQGFLAGYHLTTGEDPDARVSALCREHVAALKAGNYFRAALTQLEAVRRLPDLES